MESLRCYKLVHPNDAVHLQKRLSNRTILSATGKPCWIKNHLQNDSLEKLRKIFCNEYSAFQSVHPDDLDMLQHIVVLDSSRDV